MHGFSSEDAVHEHTVNVYARGEACIPQMPVDRGPIQAQFSGDLGHGETGSTVSNDLPLPGGQAEFRAR
ncbi:hypothetical protein GCM10010207_78010 [Streptomyces atratus]|nr:hypothetical protein GCM10010207_78010 [Streptomyces atratus]